MEPVVDVLGLVYLEENNALGTFTILDRTMPLYICFVYPWYVGGLGYLAYRLFQSGITRRTCSSSGRSTASSTSPWSPRDHLAGTYLYYGHQPLNPWGFPLWWGFVNPVMPMVAGALIYKIRPHLKRTWKLLAIIPLIPMADGIANGAAAWPMWITLNQQDVSMWVTYIACPRRSASRYTRSGSSRWPWPGRPPMPRGNIFDQLKALVLPSAKSAPADAAPPRAEAPAQTLSSPRACRS